ncbi:MAG TPA: NADH-quinone oxidoreductase subunit L [Planctomycetota bacterium]|nr:NADH-quinone oxidoreductase subunit L [Planctomycetota bacterium]
MGDIYIQLPTLILFTPLLGFAVILFFGKWLDKIADRISIAAMGFAFLCSVCLFIHVAPQGASLQGHPITRTFSWINIGGVDLQMGYLIDQLSAFFCCVVTGLATLVLVYSIFYMHGDSMYRRYFGFMCFFCFAMLGIVLSNNLLMTYVFWELVGLGSYFLIGFWFYKPVVAKDHHYQELKASYATGIDERYLSPAHAQKKGFVMNRIGDFGFAIGIGFFFATMYAVNRKGGPLNFDALYQAKQDGVFNQITLLGLSGNTLLTLAGIFTFMGAMGKSAQFPLHTWLPDAMQGPTTGSSIIHAATMVAAGVYMTARISPLLTDGSAFFVAIIGGITAFLAATMALVQWDIKAVLAYSTISQLGYMMIGLGAGAYTSGVAHLFTHAIFKCMLFLCAGSVIHACHHLQDMNRMGGLKKKMPVTYLTMLAGTLAIAGVPFFSAFYSKDAILAGSLARALHMGGIHYLPFILGIVTAGLTTFYMFRLIFMTFHGEPRDQHIYEQAHESPALATVPLCILATLCLGFWWGGHFIGGDIIPAPYLRADVTAFEMKGEKVETSVVKRGWVDALMVSPASLEAKYSEEKMPPVEEVEEAEHMEEHHHLGHKIATGLSVVMLVLGWLVAMAMYVKKSVSPDNLLKVGALRGAYDLFSQLWYFDRVYQDGIVPAAKWVNRKFWQFDAAILDGILVDGWSIVVKSISGVARFMDNWFVDKCVDFFGWVTALAGVFARILQYGRIQYYVCVTFGVVAVVLLWLMLAMPK